MYIHNNNKLLSLFLVLDQDENEASAHNARAACAPNLPKIISLLRLLDSNFPGNFLWAWEFHLFKSRLCLSKTL